MARLSDIYNESSRDLAGNICLSACTLAINAASAATFKTTGTTTYIADGFFKTKTALAAQAFTAGHSLLTAGQTGYYVVALDSSGTVKTFEGIGAIPDVENVVGNSYTPIGFIKIAVKTGQTFQTGTDALDNTTKATITFYDVAVLPSVAP